MYFWYSVVLLLYIAKVQNSLGVMNEVCPNVRKSLNAVRKRRHLAFPDGSNAALTIDFAKAFLTHVPSGWMVTMDLDVTFPLPNAEFTAAHSRRKIHHKQKRDVWSKVREALDFHNFNGRACLLRSICEAKMHLAPPGRSLVHDLLRAILTVPSLEKEFEEEMADHFHEVLDPHICEQIHECPVSLLNFILLLNHQKKSQNKIYV